MHVKNASAQARLTTASVLAAKTAGVVRDRYWGLRTAE